MKLHYISIFFLNALWKYDTNVFALNLKLIDRAVHHVEKQTLLPRCRLDKLAGAPAYFSDITFRPAIIWSHHSSAMKRDDLRSEMPYNCRHRSICIPWWAETGSKVNIYEQKGHSLYLRWGSTGLHFSAIGSCWRPHCSAAHIWLVAVPHHSVNQRLLHLLFPACPESRALLCGFKRSRLNAAPPPDAKGHETCS